MNLNNLEQKYQEIWKLALPLLKNGRPGDDVHAEMVADKIMSYSGHLEFDRDILIPVAMLHDIGHSAILPEHFAFITGSEKLVNGKLVHMLAGAKIALGILTDAHYDAEKIGEIVEIVSMHDADQLKGIELEKAYDSKHKKIFHDIDSLDRFNDKRIASFKELFKDEAQMRELLEKSLSGFFFDEFRQVAEDYIRSSK